jgi:hypothetical protein
MRISPRSGPEPEPAVTPEEMPWARLDRAFRTVLTVPKDQLLREEAKVKSQRKRKRIKKTA